MSQATEKNASYLTEAILSIHNEVQSALDYISTVANTEGTELGKSSALLSIENLRVKIPVKISIEAGKKKLPETENREMNTDEIRKALVQRTGFVIERDLPKNFSIYSKVRVAFRPEDLPVKAPVTGEQEAAPVESGWGEIEITFAPIKRQ